MFLQRTILKRFAGLDTCAHSYMFGEVSQRVYCAVVVSDEDVFLVGNLASPSVNVMRDLSERDGLVSMLHSGEVRVFRKHTKHLPRSEVRGLWAIDSSSITAYTDVDDCRLHSGIDTQPMADWLADMVLGEHERIRAPQVTVEGSFTGRIKVHDGTWTFYRKHGFVADHLPLGVLEALPPEDAKPEPEGSESEPSRNGVPIDGLGFLTHDGRSSYRGSAAWMGQEVALRIYAGDDGQPGTVQVDLARATLANQEYWDALCREEAADELHDLKNESWLSEGEEPVTREEFMARIQLRSIVPMEETQVGMGFGDDDMFAGHSIHVRIDPYSRKVRDVMLWG